MNADPAEASVPYPPITSVGIYMSNISGNAMYDLGCFFGSQQASKSGAQDFLALFSFGEPRIVGGLQGASMFYGADKDTGAIAGGVKSFSHGWWDCNNTTANDNLYIAMGTTNSGSNVTVDNGAAWGRAVESVRDYERASGYSDDITARGALDAEIDWGPPIPSWQWWLGFNSTSSSAVYDFGDAGGCPMNASGNCQTERQVWSRADIWHVAQDAAAPQIYRSDGQQAQQWYWNSRWAVLNENDSITFRAALSQKAACDQTGDPCAGVDNTPREAYAQLYNALDQSDGTRQTPWFMVNIMWQEVN